MNLKGSPLRPTLLKLVSVLLFCILACSCSTIPLKSPDAFIAEYEMTDVSPQNFHLCYSHGCMSRVSTSLTETEWEIVRKNFIPAPETPAEERKQIARAIQELELITGEKTGINTDIGGSFTAIFSKNQMDCEDEAVNTNIFLLFFQRDNLLRFHKIYGISRRGNLLSWPHMATSISDTSSGEIFVVDSWFFDQGMPVNIVPEEIWKSGWRPDPEDYALYHNQPLNKSQTRE